MEAWLIYGTAPIRLVNEVVSRAIPRRSEWASAEYTATFSPPASRGFFSNTRLLSFERLDITGQYFTDPIPLLETCDGMNLEGIVSKRKDSAYRSGSTKGWLKIKTAAWRAANR